MGDRKQVLITGAAGLVGGILRAHWGDRYTLRLVDIKPVEDTAAHETFRQVDITDYDQLRVACREIATLVHLAADPNPTGAPRREP